MRITAVLEDVDQCDSTTFLVVVEKKRTGIVGKTFASSVLSEWILLKQMTEHLCTFWAELTMAGNCNVGDCSGFCGPNVANVPICQARFWPQGYRCCSNTLTCVDGGQHCLFADLFHHSAQSVNSERAIFVPNGLHGAVCFGPVASRELKESFALWIQLEQIQPQSSITIG